MSLLNVREAFFSPFEIVLGLIFTSLSPLNGSIQMLFLPSKLRPPFLPSYHSNQSLPLNSSLNLPSIWPWAPRLADKTLKITWLGFVHTLPPSQLIAQWRPSVMSLVEFEKGFYCVAQVIYSRVPLKSGSFCFRLPY